MIDANVFRAAAECQDAALAPPAMSFTVTFDEAQAATVQRLAVMAGVPAQTIVQRLATASPFPATSAVLFKQWTFTCPETGRLRQSDMRECQDHWCAALLARLGLPVVTTDR